MFPSSHEPEPKNKMCSLDDCGCGQYLFGLESFESLMYSATFLEADFEQSIDMGG